MTRLLSVLHPDDPAIEHAAALLRAGELVAFPTETVYGLGANAFDAEAVAKIFTAKGRPSNDPLIVHISDLDMLPAVIVHLTPLAESLATLWPAPLTLVLRRGERIPPLVSAGLPTVGVRMPAHPIALALIRAAGVPIAAPSANRFAHTSPTTAQHVYADLNGKIALILDGGETPVGVESSIVDCTTQPPRLLRPGGVSVEVLRQFAPDIVLAERFADGEGAAESVEPSEPLPAPGMLLKHYAPDVPLMLFEGADQAVREAIQREADLRVAAGQAVGLLLAEEDLPHLFFPPDQGRMVQVVSLGSLADLDGVARRLYAGLRAMEKAGVSVMLARSYPAVGAGLAIRDRLIRAAAGKVIRLPD
jgi:L-threonylcarbamoyladenylate synthase